MARRIGLPLWTMLVPPLAWVIYLGYRLIGGPVATGVLAVAMLAAVLAAVHHAEVIAHRVGEPFGTFLFAVAVTVIEVGLIVSIMISGGLGSNALPRDTVLAAIMIILNGVVGMCLLVGALKHGEQRYVQTGVSAALATLAALSVLVLILPNHVQSMPGPYYSPAQLAFIGVVSLVLYGTFVLIQTIRHRSYFLPTEISPFVDTDHIPRRTTAIVSAGLLVICLGAVVWLAKTLGPSVEGMVTALGAPKALVGVIIAGVVLLPEGLAALRAARMNRLQTSLNLALGSALATIGLTIPVVAALALWFGWDLPFGVDPRNTVLLLLTLLVATLTLSTGRTTVMQGALHLLLFAVFLFMLVVP